MTVHILGYVSISFVSISPTDAPKLIHMKKDIHFNTYVISITLLFIKTITLQTFTYFWLLWSERAKICNLVHSLRKVNNEKTEQSDPQLSTNLEFVIYTQSNGV